MGVYVIANKFSSAKTLTSYYLAKYQSSLGKKVIIFNFSDESIFKKLTKNWKKFRLSNFQNDSNITANIMKGPSFDFFNIFSSTESHNFSLDEIHKKIEYITKVILNIYEILIIDCTSTSSAINQYFISGNFNILVPVILNSESEIHYFSSFLQFNKEQKNNVHYFFASFDKNNNNHIFNSIKFKKDYSSFLMNNFISFFESTDETLIFNKREVEEEYKNIFKELKIV